MLTEIPYGSYYRSPSKAPGSDGGGAPSQLAYCGIHNSGINYTPWAYQYANSYGFSPTSYERDYLRTPAKTSSGIASDAPSKGYVCNKKGASYGRYAAWSTVNDMLFSPTDVAQWTSYRSPVKKYGTNYWFYINSNGGGMAGDPSASYWFSPGFCIG